MSNGNGHNGNGEMLRRVADNLTLTVANRLVGPIGIPIVCALLIWIGNSTVETRQDVAVVKAQVSDLRDDYDDLDDDVDDHESRLSGVEGWIANRIGVRD
jgi:hypothetical protein